MTVPAMQAAWQTALYGRVAHGKLVTATSAAPEAGGAPFQQFAFQGRHFVTWAVTSGRVPSRLEGVRLGEALRARDIIRPASWKDRRSFRDDGGEWVCRSPHDGAVFSVAALFNADNYVMAAPFHKQGSYYINPRFVVLDRTLHRLYIFTDHTSCEPRKWVDLDEHQPQVWYIAPPERLGRGPATTLPKRGSGTDLTLQPVGHGSVASAGHDAADAIADDDTDTETDEPSGSSHGGGGGVAGGASLTASSFIAAPVYMLSSMLGTSATSGSVGAPAGSSQGAGGVSGEGMGTGSGKRAGGSGGGGGGGGASSSGSGTAGTGDQSHRYGFMLTWRGVKVTMYTHSSKRAQVWTHALRAMMAGHQGPRTQSHYQLAMRRRGPFNNAIVAPPTALLPAPSALHTMSAPDATLASAVSPTMPVAIPLRSNTGNGDAAPHPAAGSEEVFVREWKSRPPSMAVAHGGSVDGGGAIAHSFTLGELTPTTPLQSPPIPRGSMPATASPMLSASMALAPGSVASPSLAPVPGGGMGLTISSPLPPPASQPHQSQPTIAVATVADLLSIPDTVVQSALAASHVCLQVPPTPPGTSASTTLPASINPDPLLYTPGLVPPTPAIMQETYGTALEVYVKSVCGGNIAMLRTALLLHPARLVTDLAMFTPSHQYYLLARIAAMLPVSSEEVDAVRIYHDKAITSERRYQRRVEAAQAKLMLQPRATTLEGEGAGAIPAGALAHASVQDGRRSSHVSAASGSGGTGETATVGGGGAATHEGGAPADGSPSMAADGDGAHVPADAGSLTHRQRLPTSAGTGESWEERDTTLPSFTTAAAVDEEGGWSGVSPVPAQHGARSPHPGASPGGSTLEGISSVLPGGGVAVGDGVGGSGRVTIPAYIPPPPFQLDVTLPLPQVHLAAHSAPRTTTTPDAATRPGRHDGAHRDVHAAAPMMLGVTFMEPPDPIAACLKRVRRAARRNVKAMRAFAASQGWRHTRWARGEGPDDHRLSVAGLSHTSADGAFGMGGGGGGDEEEEGEDEEGDDDEEHAADAGPTTPGRSGEQDGGTQGATPGHHPGAPPPSGHPGAPGHGGVGGLSTPLPAPRQAYRPFSSFNGFVIDMGLGNTASHGRTSGSGKPLCATLTSVQELVEGGGVTETVGVKPAVSFAMARMLVQLANTQAFSTYAAAQQRAEDEAMMAAAATVPLEPSSVGDGHSLLYARGQMAPPPTTTAPPTALAPQPITSPPPHPTRHTASGGRHGSFAVVGSGGGEVGDGGRDRASTGLSATATSVTNAGVPLKHVQARLRYGASTPTSTSPATPAGVHMGLVSPPLPRKASMLGGGDLTATPPATARRGYATSFSSSVGHRDSMAEAVGSGPGEGGALASTPTSRPTSTGVGARPLGHESRRGVVADASGGGGAVTSPPAHRGGKGMGAIVEREQGDGDWGFASPPPSHPASARSSQRRRQGPPRSGGSMAGAPAPAPTSWFSSLFGGSSSPAPAPSPARSSTVAVRPPAAASTPASSASPHPTMTISTSDGGGFPSPSLPSPTVISSKLVGAASPQGLGRSRDGGLPSPASSSASSSAITARAGHEPAAYSDPESDGAEHGDSDVLGMMQPRPSFTAGSVGHAGGHRRPHSPSNLSTVSDATTSTAGPGGPGRHGSATAGSVASGSVMTALSQQQGISAPAATAHRRGFGRHPTAPHGMKSAVPLRTSSMSSSASAGDHYPLSPSGSEGWGMEAHPPSTLARSTVANLLSSALPPHMLAIMQEAHARGAITLAFPESTPPPPPMQALGPNVYATEVPQDTLAAWALDLARTSATMHAAIRAATVTAAKIAMPEAGAGVAGGTARPAGMAAPTAITRSGSVTWTAPSGSELDTALSWWSAQGGQAGAVRAAAAMGSTSSTAPPTATTAPSASAIIKVMDVVLARWKAAVTTQTIALLLAGRHPASHLLQRLLSNVQALYSPAALARHGVSVDEAAPCLKADLHHALDRMVPVVRDWSKSWTNQLNIYGTGSAYLKPTAAFVATFNAERDAAVMSPCDAVCLWPANLLTASWSSAAIQLFNNRNTKAPAPAGDATGLTQAWRYVARLSKSMTLSERDCDEVARDAIHAIAYSALSITVANLFRTIHQRSDNSLRRAYNLLWGITSRQLGVPAQFAIDACRDVSPIVNPYFLASTLLTNAAAVRLPMPLLHTAMLSDLTSGGVGSGLGGAPAESPPPRVGEPATTSSAIVSAVPTLPSPDLGGKRKDGGLSVGGGPFAFLAPITRAASAYGGFGLPPTATPSTLAGLGSGYASSMAGRPTASFHGVVPAFPQYHAGSPTQPAAFTHFQPAIDMLQLLPHAPEPYQKLRIITAMVETLCKTITHYRVGLLGAHARATASSSGGGGLGRGDKVAGATPSDPGLPATLVTASDASAESLLEPGVLTADDLLGLCTFIVVHAGVPNIMSQLEFVYELVGEEGRLERTGFYLTSLHAGAMHCVVDTAAAYMACGNCEPPVATAGEGERVALGHGGGSLPAPVTVRCKACGRLLCATCDAAIHHDPHALAHPHLRVPAPILFYNAVLNRRAVGSKTGSPVMPDGGRGNGKHAVASGSPGLPPSHHRMVSAMADTTGVDNTALIRPAMLRIGRERAHSEAGRMGYEGGGGSGVGGGGGVGSGNGDAFTTRGSRGAGFSTPGPALPSTQSSSMLLSRRAAAAAAMGTAIPQPSSLVTSATTTGPPTATSTPVSLHHRAMDGRRMRLPSSGSAMPSPLPASSSEGGRLSPYLVHAEVGGSTRLSRSSTRTRSDASDESGPMPPAAHHALLHSTYLPTAMGTAAAARLSSPGHASTSTPGSYLAATSSRSEGGGGRASSVHSPTSGGRNTPRFVSFADEDELDEAERLALEAVGDVDEGQAGGLGRGGTHHRRHHRTSSTIARHLPRTGSQPSVRGRQLSTTSRRSSDVGGGSVINGGVLMAPGLASGTGADVAGPTEGAPRASSPSTASSVTSSSDDSAASGAASSGEEDSDGGYSMHSRAGEGGDAAIFQADDM